MERDWCSSDCDRTQGTEIGVLVGDEKPGSSNPELRVTHFPSRINQPKLLDRSKRLSVRNERPRSS